MFQTFARKQIPNFCIQTSSSMAIEDDTIKRHPPKRNEPNLPYLMPEIITKILSRMPVKSLLRFRSVSKSWRSMISDPKFVKTHLTICSKDEEISHRNLKFLSFTERDTKAIVTCHISSIFNVPSPSVNNPLKLDYLMKHPDFYVMNGLSVNPVELDYPAKPDCVSIVGSINGLVCIHFGERCIYLWNPSTRISKRLPDLGIKPGQVDDDIDYGFGYDESTEDYKVVVIISTCSKFSYVNKIMVYSSRIGFWRRIDDFPLNISLHGEGMLLNGAIHWAADKYTVQQPDGYRVIVTLDTANETYGEMESPTPDRDECSLMCFTNLGECSMMTLAVMGECLYVLYYFEERVDFHLRHTDIWMMKEYGARDSWIKLTTIPYTNIHRCCMNPLLLYLSENHEILCEFRAGIVLFDLQSKSFRNHDIINFDFNGPAVTYVESLVSPLIQQGFERQP